MPRCLFLGYPREKTRLIAFIESKGWSVDQTEDPVSDLSGHDLVVSFGYRHILRAPVLATARRPVLNLHIAYLPYNRGAHPLYWAVQDGTPIGVTIHEIDAGIDTGPICFQEIVEIKAGATYASGYAKLIEAMEGLFIERHEALLNGTYAAKPQAGEGTFRRASELPPDFPGWGTPIKPHRAACDEPTERQYSA